MPSEEFNALKEISMIFVYDAKFNVTFIEDLNKLSDPYFPIAFTLLYENQAGRLIIPHRFEIKDLFIQLDPSLSSDSQLDPQSKVSPPFIILYMYLIVIGTLTLATLSQFAFNIFHINSHREDDLMYESS